MHPEQPLCDSWERRILDGLNSAQMAAVLKTSGPLLVLAGAGTGKTRVLTSRFAHLCTSRQAFPSQILAVTFTNKAAAEMRERIIALLPPPYQNDSLWLGTFHHIGLRILRRHGENLGLPSPFTIVDKDDQLRVIKQVFRLMSVDEKKYPPRLALWIVERLKDRALLPDQVTAAELTRLHVSPDAIAFYQAFYQEYQNGLKTLCAVDFGDLMMLNIDLFRKCPDILAQYNRQFRHILVDEYQDINVAQYLWLRLLSQGVGNICCVGDDDQSIYGWRGAEVDHILRFERDFQGAELIRLEENYRSTPHILDAASGLIAQNTRRLGKTLTPFRTVGAHDKVLVKGVWDDREEARFVGREVESLLQQGNPPNTIAILVRAGFQTREFEERLMILNVPYRIVGSLRFYDRLEIREALAYLRVVAQPDDSLAFEKILNVPKRGLGAVALKNLHGFARAKEQSLFRAAEDLLASDHLKGAARLALRTLVSDIHRWHTQAGTADLPQLVQMILDESGYTGFWKADGSTEAMGRLDNLKELVKVTQEFDTLQGFLEHVSLVTDTLSNTQEAAVSIMTLHMAKGLEFETVFLTGWEEGLFPSPKTLEEKGQDGLEEERRLAYVGLTRAKSRAVISFAWSRRFYQGWQSTTPSRFIEELPEDCVVREMGQRYGPQSHGSGKSKDTWGESFNQETVENNTFGQVGHPRFGPNKPFAQRSTLERLPVTDVTEVTLTDDGERLSAGDRVTHPQFGEGIVRIASASHAEIAFQSGTRKIMSRFLTRA